MCVSAWPFEELVLRIGRLVWIYNIPSSLCASECLKSCSYKRSSWGGLCVWVCVSECVFVLYTLCLRGVISEKRRDPRSNRHHLFIYLFSDIYSSSSFPLYHSNTPKLYLYLWFPPGAASHRSDFTPLILWGSHGESWIIDWVFVHRVWESDVDTSAAQPALHPVWCFHNKITLKLPHASHCLFQYVKFYYRGQHLCGTSDTWKYTQHLNTPCRTENWIHKSASVSVTVSIFLLGSKLMVIQCQTAL